MVICDQVIHTHTIIDTDFKLTCVVLGAEKDKFKDQYVYQSKRSLVGSNDRKRQIWKLNEEGKLILTDDKHGLFALVN